METLKIFMKKLTSRKFLIAVVGIISGLATVFSNSEDWRFRIAGIICAGASGIAYMVIEGKVDEKQVAQTVISTVEKIETTKKEAEKESEVK